MSKQNKTDKKDTKFPQYQCKQPFHSLPSCGLEAAKFISKSSGCTNSKA